MSINLYEFLVKQCAARASNGNVYRATWSQFYHATGGYTINSLMPLLKDNKISCVYLPDYSRQTNDVTWDITIIESPSCNNQ